VNVALAGALLSCNPKAEFDRSDQPGGLFAAALASFDAPTRAVARCV
jgi:hypothetical protein